MLCCLIVGFTIRYFIFYFLLITSLCTYHLPNLFSVLRWKLFLELEPDLFLPHVDECSIDAWWCEECRNSWDIEWSGIWIWGEHYFFVSFFFLFMVALHFFFYILSDFMMCVHFSFCGVLSSKLCSITHLNAAILYHELFPFYTTHIHFSMQISARINSSYILIIEWKTLRSTSFLWLVCDCDINLVLDIYHL